MNCKENVEILVDNEIWDLRSVHQKSKKEIEHKENVMIDATSSIFQVKKIIILHQNNTFEPTRRRQILWFRCSNEIWLMVRIRII